jgi:hypothetical protein
MMSNTLDVMTRGMACLTEGLGVIEAEQFISIIIREKFDYTKWQRQFFDVIPQGEFHRNALEYAKAHPYSGAAEHL